LEVEIQACDDFLLFDFVTLDGFLLFDFVTLDDFQQNRLQRERISAPSPQN
jgi:hypothetical protein